jgi:hypothetical protein
MYCLEQINDWAFNSIHFQTFNRRSFVAKQYTHFVKEFLWKNNFLPSEFYGTLLQRHFEASASGAIGCILFVILKIIIFIYMPVLMLFKHIKHFTILVEILRFL